MRLYKNYTPGDVIPPNGNWICPCGIGNKAEEATCVSCGRSRQFIDREAHAAWKASWGELAHSKPTNHARLPRPTFPFVSQEYRSLFRRVATTGAIVVVE